MAVLLLAARQGSRRDLSLVYYTGDPTIRANGRSLRHIIVWLPIAALCDRIEQVGCCPATQLEERLMPDQSVRNPAIVLVEDEPDILIILHRLMRDLTGGYDIVTVNGGAEALAQIALRPVPLVITDYNMPGMNGLQLTAAIKETAPDTRVVLITAYATPELEKRAREHRVDYYLPKPFPLDRLEQIVRDVLR